MTYPLWSDGDKLTDGFFNIYVNQHGAHVSGAWHSSKWSADISLSDGRSPADRGAYRINVKVKS